MKLIWSIATHAGRARGHNEDSAGVYMSEISHVINEHMLLRSGLSQGPTLFAVADGLGGHRAGATASLTAARGLRDWLHPLIGVNPSEYEELMIKRAHDLDFTIKSKANESVSLRTMATTLSALFLTDDKATLVHIGDSRIYRFRENELCQLTDDHTVAAESLRSEESANLLTSNRLSGALTAALGDTGSSTTRILSRSCISRPGDIYILCTDGLTNHLEDGEMRKIFAATGFLTRARLAKLTGEMLELALEKGGSDNVTLVVCVCARSWCKSVVDRIKTMIGINT